MVFTVMIFGPGHLSTLTNSTACSMFILTFSSKSLRSQNMNSSGWFVLLSIIVLLTRCHIVMRSANQWAGNTLEYHKSTAWKPSLQEYCWYWYFVFSLRFLQLKEEHESLLRNGNLEHVLWSYRIKIRGVYLQENADLYQCHGTRVQWSIAVCHFGLGINVSKIKVFSLYRITTRLRCGKAFKYEDCVIIIIFH